MIFDSLNYILLGIKILNFHKHFFEGDKQYVFVFQGKSLYKDCWINQVFEEDQKR